MPYECRICKKEFEEDALEHLFTIHPDHPISKELKRILQIWCPSKEVELTK